MIRASLTLAAIILAVSLKSGCDRSSPSPGPAGVPVSGDPDDPVYGFDDDAADMNAAIQKARDTVDQFIRDLQDPKAMQIYFSVKKPFASSDGGNEHIWLTDITYDGALFHGKVGNIPADVPGLTEGDPASVSKTELSDWMIVDSNRRLTGGYTIRVMRDRMTPEDRAKFDEELGLILD
jgi:uncharacterized protein YegJ (DUF2314 family)